MGVIHNKMAIKRLRDGTAAAVADLQDQIDNLDPGGGLSVTVTDITEDITTDPEIVTEGVTCTVAVLETYGAIVHFHAEFTADAGGTGIDGFIYTVPEELRPRYNLSALSVNGGDAATSGYYEGGIFVEHQFSGPENAFVDTYWIANPAPAPEPGE